MILYTTKCPKCQILKDLLNKNCIKFNEINDIEIIKQKGFTHVPMLEDDNNTIMTFAEAVKWMNDKK